MRPAKPSAARAASTVATPVTPSRWSPRGRRGTSATSAAATVSAPATAKHAPGGWRRPPPDRPHRSGRSTSASTGTMEPRPQATCSAASAPSVPRGRGTRDCDHRSGRRRSTHVAPAATAQKNSVIEDPVEDHSHVAVGGDVGERVRVPVAYERASDGRRHHVDDREEHRPRERSATT